MRVQSLQVCSYSLSQSFHNYYSFTLTTVTVLVLIPTAKCGRKFGYCLPLPRLIFINIFFFNY